MKFEEIDEKLVTWARDRDILKKENATRQMLKLVEEVGELAEGINKNNDEKIIDGIGDSLVVLIILARQLGYNPSWCLQIAYNEIKDRKGKTVDGVFIKNKP